MNKHEERVLISRGCALMRSRLRIRNNEIKKLRGLEREVHDFVTAASINGLSLHDAERNLNISVSLSIEEHLQNGT